MNIKVVYIALIFLLLGEGYVHSQERNTEVLVDFRVNSTHIDTNYKNNAEKVSNLISFLEKIQTDSTINIVNISFCGAASPEGSYQLNRMLAKGRMQSLERLVRSKVDIPDNIITYDDSYIPWEYLAEKIQEADISHKEEILSIIGEKSEIVNYSNGRSIDSRIPKLQKLDDGKVWKEMLRRFFSPMRNACVVFITLKAETLPKLEPIVTENIYTFPIPDIIHLAPLEPIPLAVPVANEWTRTLSVKTNALGLGLAIANAAVEIDICKHWSFNLPVYYSAWNYFTSTVKFRTLAVQPEIRYWFSEKNPVNDGWFVGAHFGLAYYNIATDGEYRTQDHDGTSPALGGGLAVGYRMPISKNNRWKMEFSIGAGAYKLHHDKFHNYHNGLLVYTEKKTYIGIDQASVSFSYTFDLKRKGGAR
ncbi:MULTISPECIES: DUF3575 domain-containing protein [Bacteroides]|uniref:DUF3575 domain-containing protein n=1 Tax=Bacteroides TaxID=816 RepID=UPI00319E9D4C